MGRTDIYGSFNIRGGYLKNKDAINSLRQMAAHKF